MHVGRVGIKGVVAVIGGGASELASDADGIFAAAKKLGKRLATLQSAHLLTGGGKGVAESVSEGFYGVHPRSGIILAVVPGVGAKSETNPSPNDFVEIPVYAPYGNNPTASDSTAHIVAKTADVIVALPGAEDVLTFLDLVTKAKAKYGKPTIVYLPEGAGTVGGKNAAALKRAKYNASDSLDEVIAFVERALADTGR